MIRFLQILMVTIGLAMAPLDANAQRGPRPGPATYAQANKANKVSLQMMVVQATASHKRVDDRLKSLIRNLGHLRYTGYSLLQTHNAQLSPKGTQTFTIQGGHKVQVQLLSKDAKRARMRVQMTKGGSKLLDTTLSVNRNGTFIVAGPKYKDGILVLPLTARY